jgi:hypothetical protein
MGWLADEGGVFGLMVRYAKAGVPPNFEVFLKGHVGSPMVVDRVGRPALHVARPALTLGLAVQPDVLRALRDMPGARDRGLMARFLYAIPASKVGGREVHDRSLAAEVMQRYEAAVNRVAAEAEKWGSSPIKLGSDAAEAFHQFRARVERRMAFGGDLAPIADWANKLPGAVGRVVGLLHVAEGAGHEEVAERTMLAAVRMAEEHLVPHARAAFADMGADPVRRDALYLLNWIQKKVVASEDAGTRTFSKRAAHKANESRFQKSADLDKPLALLVDRGFIRPVPSARRPGRPSEVYEVNPVVSSVLSDSP